MKKPDPRKAASIADVLEKYRGTIPDNSFLENAVLGVNKSTRDLKLGLGGLLSDALPESVGAALGLPTRADVDVEKAAFGGALGAIGPATKTVVGKIMDKVSPKEAVLSPEMLRALAHRPMPAMGLSGDEIARGVAPHMINDVAKLGSMTGYEPAARYLGGYGGQTMGRMMSNQRIPDSVLKLNREFDDLMEKALAAQQKRALIDELSKYQMLPVAAMMGPSK